MVRVPTPPGPRTPAATSLRWAMPGGALRLRLMWGTGRNWVYEGATVNVNQTELSFTGDPDGAYTVTIPNRNGTLVTTGDTGSVTGGMILNDTVVLTTDTDGDYVAGFTAGNGLTGGGAGGGSA